MTVQLSISHGHVFSKPHSKYLLDVVVPVQVAPSNHIRFPTCKSTPRLPPSPPCPLENIQHSLIRIDFRDPNIFDFVTLPVCAQVLSLGMRLLRL